MNSLFVDESSLPFGFRLLQESPYLRIFYDERNHWLHADWVGAQTFETVQAGSEMLIRWATTQRCTKLLNDNTHVTAMPLVPEEWRQIGAMGQLHELGMHYIAWVYGPTQVVRHAADIAVSNVRYPIVLTFDTIGIATEWLQHV